MTTEPRPLHVPAIYAREVHHDGQGLENTFGGTLYFDERPMFLFEGREHAAPAGSKRLTETDVRCLELPGQSHDELHAAMAEAFSVLARVTELLEYSKDHGLTNADPAEALKSVANEARWRNDQGRIMGDLILHRDLRDLPPTPLYVLADDDDFGDYRGRDISIIRTLVVPCEDEDIARRATQQLRRFAVSHPRGWDDPALSNLRTVRAPLPVVVRGAFYSLVSIAPKSWLWLDREEVPPPDQVLAGHFVYTNERTHQIGEFDVPGGELILRDPAHELDGPFTWPKEDSFVTVVPGRYRAYAKLANQIAMPDNVHGGLVVVGVVIEHTDPQYAGATINLDDTCASIGVDTGNVMVAAGWDTFEFGSDRAADVAYRHPLQILDDVMLAQLVDVNSGAPRRAIGFCTPSGGGDGCYQASPARRADGAIVGVAVPFLMRAFAPDYASKDEETKLEVPPYYATLPGLIDSYHLTMKRRKKEPLELIGPFAEALRAAARGERTLLDAIGTAEVADAVDRVIPAARDGNAYDRRGADLLEQLVGELRRAPRNAGLTDPWALDAPPADPNDDEEIPW